MKATVRLFWNADHTSIVPKGHADAAELFGREGCEVSPETVRQYGIDAYVERAQVLKIRGDGTGEALPPFAKQAKAHTENKHRKLEEDK